MPEYVLAIDQGTSSTRAILFDRAARISAIAQCEHTQIYPRPGWVEHDPMQVWGNLRRVVDEVLARVGVTPRDVIAAGITNQRETVVVWDRRSGVPVTNAITWQDARTRRIAEDLAGDAGADRYKDIVGLPLATYFSGPKIRWVLDYVDGAREAAERGDLAFGTIDTWLLWNLTGGIDNGLHLTDVTNASRTMLMDLETLAWREDICSEMGIPLSMLPRICSSSELYGRGHDNGPLPDVPISGILGDQQAAAFGQACFTPGMVKCTYGTGNFLLRNTGTRPVRSANGLLTTVGYQLGAAAPTYALEGSIAVTGSLVQWLRDSLGMFERAPDIEALAAAVEDNGGAYLVPAFSGLFAPHWRPDARGALLGLTRYVTKNHVARAALEATAFQTREVVEAMNADAGVALAELRVDGGMVENELLMQFQADQLHVDVVRPLVRETTALGAAFAAGIAVGFWGGEQDVIDNWSEDRRWAAQMSSLDRDQLYRNWKKAVTKTLDWVDGDVDT